MFLFPDRDLPNEGDAAQQAQVDLLLGLRLLRTRPRRAPLKFRRQVLYRRNQKGSAKSPVAKKKHFPVLHLIEILSQSGCKAALLQGLFSADLVLFASPYPAY